MYIQALISLSRSENEDDRNLVRAIYGVVFFGTPHDGMDITSLIPMAGDSSPNRSLIESLSRNNSQVLTAQQRDFHRALGDKGNSEVFCFYETLESPTAQQVGPFNSITIALDKLTPTRINMATGK